jgi:hypothetical protein
VSKRVQEPLDVDTGEALESSKTKSGILDQNGLVELG